MLAQEQRRAPQTRTRSCDWGDCFIRSIRSDRAPCTVDCCAPVRYKPQHSYTRNCNSVRRKVNRPVSHTDRVERGTKAAHRGPQDMVSVPHRPCEAILTIDLILSIFRGGTCDLRLMPRRSNREIQLASPQPEPARYVRFNRFRRHPREDRLDAVGLVQRGGGVLNGPPHPLLPGRNQPIRRLKTSSRRPSSDLVENSVGRSSRSLFTQTLRESSSSR